MTAAEKYVKNVIARIRDTAVHTTIIKNIVTKTAGTGALGRCGSCRFWFIRKPAGMT